MNFINYTGIIVQYTRANWKFLTVASSAAILIAGLFDTISTRLGSPYTIAKLLENTYYYVRCGRKLIENAGANVAKYAFGAIYKICKFLWYETADLAQIYCKSIYNIINPIARIFMSWYVLLAAWVIRSGDYLTNKFCK